MDTSVGSLAQDSISIIAVALATFLRFYLVMIIIRVLLSWFPNINWLSPPFSILSQLVDPYLNLFRSFIPPLGGMDFSPILAIFLLQIVAGVLSSQAAQISAQTFY